MFPEKAVLRAVGVLTLAWVVHVFFMGTDDLDGARHPPDSPEGVVERLYFVATTLSTVGYGDISPKSAVARVTTSVVLLVLSVGVLYSVLSVFRTACRAEAACGAATS